MDVNTLVYYKCTYGKMTYAPVYMLMHQDMYFNVCTYKG